LLAAAAQVNCLTGYATRDFYQEQEPGYVVFIAPLPASDVVASGLWLPWVVPEILPALRAVVMLF